MDNTVVQSLHTSILGRDVVRAMDAAAHCVDLRSLSVYLGYAPQRLFFLSQMADDLYIEIQIAKKDPTVAPRRINIPISELKGVQRSILSQILQHIEVHPAAHGYVRGLSAVRAAQRITGHKAQQKIDIKDFFPSITSARVFGLFRSLGFNRTVATILCRLCTHRSRLPQGAPTSPAISNLCCRNLDRQLTVLSQAWGMTYIRYSDDLIFVNPNNFNANAFSSTVYKVLRHNGFLPNLTKTQYTPQGLPRRALGLIVSGRKARIPRRQLRTLRAAFHKATTNLPWAQSNLDRLSGMAEYYKSVHGPDRKYEDFRRVLENVRRARVHQPYLTGA